VPSIFIENSPPNWFSPCTPCLRGVFVGEKCRLVGAKVEGRFFSLSRTIGGGSRLRQEVSFWSTNLSNGQFDKDRTPRKKGVRGRAGIRSSKERTFAGRKAKMGGVLYSIFRFFLKFFFGVPFPIRGGGRRGGWAHIFHAGEGSASGSSFHNIYKCPLYHLDRGMQEDFLAIPRREGLGIGDWGHCGNVSPLTRLGRSFPWVALRSTHGYSHDAATRLRNTLGYS
jgi:hypothetical protein